MPHIHLPEGLQGIRAAMAFRPETAKPLNELVEVLLHASNSLSARRPRTYRDVCLLPERLLLLPNGAWVNCSSVPQ